MIDAGCGPDELLEAAVLAGGIDRVACLGPRPEWLDPAVRLRQEPRQRRPLLLGRRRRLERIETTRVVTWSAAVGRPCPQGLVLRRLAWGPADAAAVADMQADGHRPTVVLSCDADRAAAQASGVAAEVIPPLAVELLCTGRQELRRRLGLGEATFAVAAPAPVDGGSNHKLAVWATAVLSVAQYDVRLLIPAWGRAAQAAWRFAQEAGFGDRVTPVSEVESPADMLAAADAVALLHESGPPPVMLATALLAGRPVVAVRTARAESCLTHEQDALLAEPTPRGVSHALFRLLDEPALGPRLAQAGAERARRLWAPGVVLPQWRPLLEASAG